MAMWQHLPRVWSVRKTLGIRPNEDRWYLRGDNGTAALSDGASVSFDSAAWARLLVRSFVELPSSVPDWLARSLSRFNQIHDRESLSWAKQAAFDRGSFASFIGLRWLSRDIVQFVLLGDSCVFLCDGDVLLESEPYKHAEQFKQNPLLVGTVGSLEKKDFDHFEFCPANYKDPSILCATDALSQWILRHESPSDALRRLRSIESYLDFEQFVIEERAASRMKVDDTTLMAFWGC